MFIEILITLAIAINMGFSMGFEPIVYNVISIVIVVYLAVSILYIIRLVKGPTIPDRVLALDALSYDLAVFMALLALLLRRPVIASGLIVLTLWIYAIDIYISKYIEAREMGE